MSRDTETRLIDGALALVQGDGRDWFMIERAEHDGREWSEPRDYGSAFMTSARISDADIEGTFDEMLGIAAAIERRHAFNARRCAVVVDGDFAAFWSPRNSRHMARVPLAVADALAVQIRGSK